MAIQYAIAIGTTVTMQPPPWIAASAPPPRNDDGFFAVIARPERPWRSSTPFQPATTVTIQPPPWIATSAPPPRKDSPGLPRRLRLLAMTLFCLPSSRGRQAVAIQSPTHLPASPSTLPITSQVLSISAWARVGWTRNISAVSPNARATGKRSAGRQPVLSKAFSR